MFAWARHSIRHTCTYVRVGVRVFVREGGCLSSRRTSPNVCCSHAAAFFAATALRLAFSFVVEMPETCPCCFMLSTVSSLSFEMVIREPGQMARDDVPACFARFNCRRDCWNCSALGGRREAAATNKQHRREKKALNLVRALSYARRRGTLTEAVAECVLLSSLRSSK